MLKNKDNMASITMCALYYVMQKKKYINLLLTHLKTLTMQSAEIPDFQKRNFIAVVCTQRFSKDDALKMAVRARRPRLFQLLHWAYAVPRNEKSLCLLSTLIHLFRTLSTFSEKKKYISSPTFSLTLFFENLEFSNIKP